MKTIRHIRARNWAWASVLAIVGIWWPAFIIFSPPDFLTDAVDPNILIICMSVALFGSIVKICGYLASQLPGKAGVLGVSSELVGLILSAVGPFTYLAISTYTFMHPIGDLKLNSAFIFACAVITIYIYRAFIIVPRFLSEAHDPSKDDS